MTAFLLLETLIVLISICFLRMGWKKRQSNQTMNLLTMGLLLVAIVSLFAYIYYSYPSGFVVKVYPNTQLDFCSENGQFVFDQVSGIVPGYSYSNATGTGFYIEHLTIGPVYKGFEFRENVLVTDLEPPWWAFGHVLKPYRDQVTLIVENGPPGLNLAFGDSSVNAGIHDNSKAMGVPPFDTEITLGIAPNTTLAYGPHYITIRGIGQDGKTESTCTCVLMVNLR
jgi:hypothetical protein